MKSHPVLKNAFLLFFLFIALLSSCNLAAQAPATSVTASDYCHFLNYTATTDGQHLYDQAMASDPVGACIVRTGAPGGYRYDVIAGREKFLITCVNESDVAAYCDWVKLTSLSFSSDFFLKCNRTGFQVTSPSNAQSQMISGGSTLISESADTIEIVTSISEGIIAAALGTLLDMRPEEDLLRINGSETSLEPSSSVMSDTSEQAILHQPEAIDPIPEAKQRAREQARMYGAAKNNVKNANDAKERAAARAEFNALLENQSEEIYWTDKIESLPSKQTPFKNDGEAQQKINAARTTWIKKQTLADKKWNAVKDREAILNARATELVEIQASFAAAKANFDRLKATNQDNETILTTSNTYYDLAQQGETAWNNSGILAQEIEQDWLQVIEADTAAQNAKAHWLNNVLHHAATATGNHKGNFGLGGASEEDASLLGKLWLGPGRKAEQTQRGITPKNGAQLSANKLRRYRPPFDKKYGDRLANFERRLFTAYEFNDHTHGGRDGHLKITKDDH